jgi:cyclic pyranopterin phosphate synthase
MVDITHKEFTLRKAKASATVQTSREETIAAVKAKAIPKGDVFEFARAAALLAIKKTSDTIPDCHPIPIEYAAISYELVDLSIVITVEVHTIYKTGVEVEAMHGASVAALVMYDMLKPVDKKVEIQNIRLLEKIGGKSSAMDLPKDLSAAVVVCSDSVSKGEKSDRSGALLVEWLHKHGIDDVTIEVVADAIGPIQALLKSYLTSGRDLVLFTGGTGLSPRDVTPEAVAPLIDVPIPGIMEAARRYGQQRVKTAMLSRGIAGFAKDTLVLTLPGSPKGVEETMQAIFPHVLHVFHVRQDRGH